MTHLTTTDLLALAHLDPAGKRFAEALDPALAAQGAPTVNVPSSFIDKDTGGANAQGAELAAWLTKNRDDKQVTTDEAGAAYIRLVLDGTMKPEEFFLAYKNRTGSLWATYQAMTPINQQSGAGATHASATAKESMGWRAWVADRPLVEAESNASQDTTPNLKGTPEGKALIDWLQQQYQAFGEKSATSADNSSLRAYFTSVLVAQNTKPEKFFADYPEIASVLWIEFCRANPEHHLAKQYKMALIKAAAAPHAAGVEKAIKQVNAATESRNAAWFDREGKPTSHVGVLVENLETAREFDKLKQAVTQVAAEFATEKVIREGGPLNTSQGALTAFGRVITRSLAQRTSVPIEAAPTEAQAGALRRYAAVVERGAMGVPLPAGLFFHTYPDDARALAEWVLVDLRKAHKQQGRQLESAERELRRSSGAAALVEQK